MYRFLLTPRWWGIHAFVLLAIPVCVFMGSWQLGRFEDRVQSHDAAEKAPDPASRKAEPLASLLPVDQRTSGRPAQARGHYAEQFLVPDREVDGKQGSYVLTLLRTDGGKALPVVRGWIPRGAKAPAVPAGDVAVTGVLQASETAGSDGVNAQGGLPQGQVGMISAASLVNLVPYPVYDAWVTLPAAGAGLTPVPASAPQNSGLDLKAFQNLGYTGEWFVFAGFVVFMWFRLVRREAEALEDAELGLAPEGAEQPADGSDQADGPGAEAGAAAKPEGAAAGA
ncbi:SURF1 family protein [Streptomyces sp. NBC_00083]|uniref:SURF1 family protein n=1 Tax=Streptomyces sp. NBC_00083 TaxID=2975647 RepID=UPI00225BDB87|nr:SURF1 family protein [Streptomyces sp. NBC_00083]MCX5388065.1 SURF1 family protein [Streptomyces sp. NBC_00083]